MNAISSINLNTTANNLNSLADAQVSGIFYTLLQTNVTLIYVLTKPTSGLFVVWSWY